MKINYRRFGRRRLLSLRVGEFYMEVFPVLIRHFQAAKAKAVALKNSSPAKRPDPRKAQPPGCCQ
jgi:hypothetical protein